MKAIRKPREFSNFLQVNDHYIGIDEQHMHMKICSQSIVQQFTHTYL